MRVTEDLQLKLPDQDDFYDVDIFNENFEKLQQATKAVESTAQIAIDLSKTFDVLAEEKGVTYTATPVVNNDLEIWTEQLIKEGTQIAERISEERTSGWKITTKIHLPGHDEVVKTATWAQDGDTWKGVTV